MVESTDVEPNHANPEMEGQLHHVEICASNLERSTEFWDWLLGKLGYEQKSTWENGTSWIKESTYIVVKQAETARQEFDRNAPGLNHLAFHAASREHVDEITSGIRSRDDAVVLYEDQHPFAGGYYALYCEDPEGIKVEVVGPEE
ncbi:MAG: VOC family protein [Halobacteriaceae archaeon]